jgi:hypothetical protein
VGFANVAWSQDDRCCAQRDHAGRLSAESTVPADFLRLVRGIGPIQNRRPFQNYRPRGPHRFRIRIRIGLAQMLDFLSEQVSRRNRIFDRDGAPLERETAFSRTTSWLIPL